MSPVHCSCDPDKESVNLKIFTSKSEALNFQFGKGNIAQCLYSIFHWLLEQSLIIVIAHNYFTEGYTKSFGASISFLLFAALATNAISLYWLIKTTASTGWEASSRHWVFRDIFHFMLLGTVWRYIEHIWLIVKIRRKQTDREKFIQYVCLAEQESALLYMMSAYFGSAPQLVLQVCLLADIIGKRLYSNATKEFIALRILTILLCLISTARSISVVKDSTWKFRANRTEPSSIGVVIRFVWYFFSNFSRAIAFGLFASVFPVYTILVCLGHWIVATFWLSILQLQLFENMWEEIVFKPLIGIIYLFHYFKVQEGPTLKSCCIYYSILTTEGTLLLVFWSLSLNPSEFWLRERILQFSGYFGTLIIGYVFMVLYYVVFHPTRNKNIFESEAATELNYLNDTANPKQTKRNTYQMGN